MTRQERFLRVFLRLLGSAGLLAVFFVFVPFSWMDAIHQWLGLGDLPDKPLVGYLARWTSAFYAMLGGLFWMLSFDLRRHRLVLCYVGAAVVFFGAALGVVLALEGMPLWWCLPEGMFNVAFGVMILGLSLRIGRDR